MSKFGVEHSRLGHDSDAIAGFLPLVDVLLAVLCIALAIAGPATREVSVELPPSYGAQPASLPSVRVTFDRHGGFWIDGRAIGVGEITNALKMVARAGLRVVIAGDAHAEYATASTLLQLLQEAGVTTTFLVLDNAKQ